MSRKCVVAQCGSSKPKKGSQETSFHELPSDPARRTCWLKIIDEWSGLRTVPPRNFLKQTYYVCGRHFTTGSFFPGTTRLNRDAVPTIFFGKITPDLPDSTEEPAAKKIRLDCITNASIPSSSVLHLTENAQSGLNHINYDNNS